MKDYVCNGSTVSALLFVKMSTHILPHNPLNVEIYHPAAAGRNPQTDEQT